MKHYRGNVAEDGVRKEKGKCRINHVWHATANRAEASHLRHANRVQLMRD